MLALVTIATGSSEGALASDIGFAGPAAVAGLVVGADRDGDHRRARGPRYQRPDGPPFLVAALVLIVGAVGTARAAADRSGRRPGEPPPAAAQSVSGDWRPSGDHRRPGQPSGRRGHEALAVR